MTELSFYIWSVWYSMSYLKDQISHLIGHISYFKVSIICLLTGNDKIARMS